MSVVKARQTCIRRNRSGLVRWAATRSRGSDMQKCSMHVDSVSVVNNSERTSDGERRKRWRRRRKREKERKERVKEDKQKQRYCDNVKFYSLLVRCLTRIGSPVSIGRVRAGRYLGSTSGSTSSNMNFCISIDVIVIASSCANDLPRLCEVSMRKCWLPMVG